MDCLLGIDVGTSGCKAAIFDSEYRVQALAAERYSFCSPQPGRAEFDPSAIWAATSRTARAALAQLGSRRRPTRFGLALSVFGEGLILTDAQGQALGPGILSADLRSAAVAARMARELDRDAVFHKTGRVIASYSVATKIIWALENWPSLTRQGSRFMDMHAWLLNRLGAGPIGDPASLSGFVLFDIDRMVWDPELLAYAHINAESLPKPIASGTPLGRLKADIATELGFAPADEVELIVGAMDQQCNAVGSGTVAPGDLICSMGTVECVTVVLDPTMRIDRLAQFNMPRAPAASPGQYVTLILLWDGGRSLAWFVEHFARKEKEEAEHIGTDVYTWLLSHEPRARNLFFLPHLSGSGTPWQNPASRGAFLGLTATADAVSAAQAIIEGLTFELRLNLENLEALGTRVTELRAVGGGAKSDRWLQVMANTLRRPVSRLAFGEAGCLGAALLAGYGGGLFDNLPVAAKHIARPGETFYPTEPDVALYERKYAIYRKIYPALVAINQEIAELERNHR